MNKRGEMIGAIVIVILIIIFLGWLINEGWKECRNDNQCKDNQICDSSFKCRDLPAVEKAAPGGNYNTALIIGAAIIIAAIIIKWDVFKGFFGKKKSNHNHGNSHEDEKPAGESHEGKAQDEKSERREIKKKSHSYKAEEEALFEEHLEHME